jgi:hypothetical protein
MPPYTHSWNIDSTGSSVSNLPSGTYTDTIKDVYDSITIVEFVLTNPDSVSYSYHADDPVNGEDNGQLRVYDINGGSGNYSILWSNGSTALTISDLPEGSYWFVITDDNGCATDTVNVSLTDDTCPEITADYSTTPDLNRRGYGTITPSNVSGYNEYYSFFWEDSTGNSNRANLDSGDYWFKIIDDVGCESDTVDVIVSNQTASIDTLIWGTDITTTQWKNKINGAINLANYWQEPDLDTLDLVSEGFEEWSDKINDFIQIFSEIENDTIVYGTDNLGQWKLKTNAAIEKIMEE